MKLTSKEIQLQFNGFLQTPCLWKGTAIYNLQQFEIEQKFLAFNVTINPKIRLGKYVERFVSYQLQQEESIKVVSENIQIQQNKITLGELDCVLFNNDTPVHLEIIYKFYVYDSRVGKTEIEHFIGPNRKDSLVDKLTKLKEKQLPLLYSKACENYLHSIHLSSKIMEQQVYFKAQLFVPFSDKSIQLKDLNQNCCVGFYINKKELQEFTSCKFFIPKKKDWLVVPHKNVNWQSYNQIKETLHDYLEREFSPLCWIKFHNGEIKKFFLVWW